MIISGRNYILGLTEFFDLMDFRGLLVPVRPCDLCVVFGLRFTGLTCDFLIETGLLRLVAYGLIEPLLNLVGLLLLLASKKDCFLFILILMVEPCFFDFDDFKD